MIFSKGSLERVFLFADNVAKISVKPPIRPKNIRQINISLETRCSPGVIPSVRPTVPIADAVSDRQVRMGSSSTRLMTIPPSRNRDMYIRKTVTAFLTVSSAIRRPKNRPFSRLRKTATAQATSTAAVVVFMPPAVEPGLPPMSIKPMVRVCPVSLRAVKLSVFVIGATAVI